MNCSALLMIVFAGMTIGQPIQWTHHALSWKDFKGRPDPGNGEPSAMTDTGFRVQLECVQGTLDIRIKPEFYPKTSWVKTGRKSVELLRHEQGHFDLTELYARKIRKAVRDARIGCQDDATAEAAGKKIFNELDREWETSEKQYDAETRYGTDLLRQEDRSASLAKQLSELSEFER